MPNLHLPSTSGLVELASIDFSRWGGPVYHYANSKMDDGSEIGASSFVFNAITYTVLPFLTEGYAAGGDAPQKPNIALPDFNGSLITQLRLYGGAPGAPVYRELILAADIMADNSGGAFAPEEYVLNKYTRSKQILTLELASPWDFAATKLPSSTMLRAQFPGLGSALAR